MPTGFPQNRILVFKTVVCNYAIAISGLTAIFSTNEKQIQNQSHLARDVSRAFRKFKVTVRNSDWFIALFAPVVNGRGNTISWCGFFFHI